MATRSNHTGQVSSLRLLKDKTSLLSSPTSDLVPQPPEAPLLEEMPVVQLNQRRRKKVSRLGEPIHFPHLFVTRHLTRFLFLIEPEEPEEDVNMGGLFGDEDEY